MGILELLFKLRPHYTEYSISIEALGALLAPLGLERAFLWDLTFYYVSLEDWGKIIRNVLFGMPKYTAEKFDCENFALAAAARTADLYKINTMGVAIGQGQGGEHGYNLFIARVDETAVPFLLEPQTGEIIPTDEPSGYKPRLVLIG